MVEQPKNHVGVPGFTEMLGVNRDRMSRTRESCRPAQGPPG